MIYPFIELQSMGDRYLDLSHMQIYFRNIVVGLRAKHSQAISKNEVVVLYLYSITRGYNRFSPNYAL